jgi:hypothetical protein
MTLGTLEVTIEDIPGPRAELPRLAPHVNGV